MDRRECDLRNVNASRRDDAIYGGSGQFLDNGNTNANDATRKLLIDFRQ